MTLLIAIDSSQQLTYTASLSSNMHNIKLLSQRIEHILSKNNVAGKWHWSKLSRKTREKLKKPLADLLEEFPSVHINILEHKRPANVERKGWFIYTVPARLAQKLEPWLQGKYGELVLLVDDDYAVVKGGRETRHFIEQLVRQFAIRLTGKETSLRDGAEIWATIKQPNGKILNFRAGIAEKDSEWIGIIDLYLGIYDSSPELLLELGNVHASKIE